MYNCTEREKYTCRITFVVFFLTATCDLLYFPLSQSSRMSVPMFETATLMDFKKTSLVYRYYNLNY